MYQNNLYNIHIYIYITYMVLSSQATNFPSEGYLIFVYRYLSYRRLVYSLKSLSDVGNFIPFSFINQEQYRDDIKRNFASQIAKYRPARKSHCFVRPLPFPTAYYWSLLYNRSATSINALFVTYYRFFVWNCALYASLVTRIARNSKLSFFQIETIEVSISAIWLFFGGQLSFCLWKKFR